MITIDKIDFSKLKPYVGKTSRSFEVMCYRMAQVEFGHLGTFTPIDGSGGDGGVEFYLKLENGEKWGWQCKLFGETGRLNVGSRSTAIEKSLETAIRNHENLTKWFLCLKTDLTENSLSKNGQFSKGERNWFEIELPKVIPVGRNINLEHWGETSFLTFLNDSKHFGIRSFFFGALEFTQNWFENKFKENFEKVKDKYDPKLHTLDKHTQSKIDFLLFDKNYINLTKGLKKDLNQKVHDIQEKIKILKKEKIFTPEERTKRKEYITLCREFEKHYHLVFDKIGLVESCFLDDTPELLSRFDLDELNDDFLTHFDPIDNYEFEENSQLRKSASDLSYLISDFNYLYNDFFNNYFHEDQRQIHFTANAAKGKTHTACDIAFKRIENSHPAIFFTGDKFTDESILIEAMRKLHDIPAEYSFDDFLYALDEYASICKVRIPIIIDGLNETTSNRFFSPIWKNHLSGFIAKVLQTKNIVVITTCRTTYAKRIWEDIYKSEFHQLNGYEDSSTIIDAIHKYFKKYKLIGDLYFAQVEKFRDPIFLKIFCETKNPNWMYSEKVAINIEEEATFSIFNEYLSQVNRRVTRDHPCLRTNEPFIQNATQKIAAHLWEENLRELLIEKYFNLIDGDSSYEEDKSKAEILINEGLVMSRDIRDQNEYVSFTYDVLAGFLIGEYLIQLHDNPSYFLSDEFINKIFNSSGGHPLAEDIISSVCRLLPQLKQTSLHKMIIEADLLRSNGNEYFKYLFGESVSSLFELPAKLIKDNDIKLVEELFSQHDANKVSVFNLSLKTISDISHPFNAKFLSRLLESQNMNDRDITWTEFIRKNSDNLESFISKFENECCSSVANHTIIAQKQHLVSKIITWVLTSTNRKLRDEATRALYFYGRKYPIEFASIVYESLEYNDPYVWERTLAALYGVVMAEHNSIKSDYFRTQVLPDLSKTIYRLIFKEDAPYSTTHILARDYARRIIEIGLIHYPNLLTKLEIKKIRPPYRTGGIRDLGEFDYGKNAYGYGGPIRMDFSNYTIGRLVKNGHGYTDPPEKQKVRRQIYWRIFDLGWNEEIFKEAEIAVGRDNYRETGRTNRADVERYGKKYSWIAYYENAGLRADKGLLDNEFDEFRLIAPDIDPSFPMKPQNQKFFSLNLLGDTTKALVDWYKNGGMPSIEAYLELKNLKDNKGDWICLDSFIVQEDLEAERNSFVFVRALIVSEKDFEEIVKLLKVQNAGEQWLPEVRQNNDTFAGEMYYCDEATEDNSVALRFTLGKKIVKIKRGEPGFQAPFTFKKKKNKIILVEDDSIDEIEKEILEDKKFKVMLPVMEYSWESYRSTTNNVEHIRVVGKEIASKLKLKNQAQSFDLIDSNSELASQNIRYYEDYNNNHSFVYIRKDLLQSYLKVTKTKLVWVIWGERDILFDSFEERQDFMKKHDIEEHKLFQEIVEFGN